MDALFPYLKEHLKFRGISEYVFSTRDDLPYYSASKISLLYWKKTLASLGILYRDMYKIDIHLLH